MKTLVRVAENRQSGKKPGAPGVPGFFETWDSPISVGTLDWEAHQVVICKNYSVISTREWLFNHTRTLSIINDLGGRLRSGSDRQKTPANPYFRYVFAGA